MKENRRVSRRAIKVDRAEDLPASRCDHDPDGAHITKAARNVALKHQHRCVAEIMVRARSPNVDWTVHRGYGGTGLRDPAVYGTQMLRKMIRNQSTVCPSEILRLKQQQRTANTQDNEYQTRAQPEPTMGPA